MPRIFVSLSLSMFLSLNPLPPSTFSVIRTFYLLPEFFYLTRKGQKCAKTFGHDNTWLAANNNDRIIALANIFRSVVQHNELPTQLPLDNSSYLKARAIYCTQCHKLHV